MAAMNCDDSAVGQDGADDPFYAQQWHLKNTGAGGETWNLGTTWDSNRGDRVLVAVVDDASRFATKTGLSTPKNPAA